MNTSHSPQTPERHKQKSFTRQLGRIWRWLTEPSAAIQKPENRRRTQLLSSLLIILIPLPIIVFIARLFTDPAFRPSLIALGGLITLLIVYGLSRTRYYKLAAGLIISLFPITIFSMVITAYTPADFNNLLSYLALGVILGSILLPIRATIILAAIDIGWLLLLPTIIPEVTFTLMISPLTFLFLLTGLIVVAMRYRNLIENDRQAELRANNCNLKQEIDERIQTELALRRSEENLRTTLNSIGDAVMATDIKGAISRMNPVAEKLSGWTLKEAQGKPLAEVFHIINANTRQPAVNPVTQVLKSGKSVGLANHTMLIAKDGTEYQIADSAAPIRDSDGNITGVVLVFRDVSEAYQVRQALRESEAKFRGLVESSSDWIWEVNREGVYTYASPQVESILGYKPEEIIGKPPFDLMPPEEKKRIEATFKDLITASKPIVALENVNLHKDGRRVVLETSGIPFSDEVGKAAGYRGVDRDVTKRVQAERALRESEQLLQNVFDAIQDGISVLDTNLNVIRTNHWMEQAYASQMPLTAQKCYQVYQQRQSACPWCPVLPTIETGEVHTEIVPYPSADDPAGWVELSAFPIKDEQVDVVSVIEYVQDITERMKSEEALRQLNQAMEQSPTSVIITDTNGIIQYVNSKFNQVTGYSADEAIGQNSYILQSGEHPPEFYREMWGTLTAGQEWRGEFHNRKKNGELYWELASIAGVKDQNGKITHYVAVKEDITQRKRLEEETLRQERLAAVGQLAAGIAHDFNNMLTAVIGYAELLRLEPGTTESAQSDLEQIVKQSQRAAHLIRQILDFSRQTANKPQPLDMKAYLNETLKFIERTIPESIQIEFSFEQGDHTISADPAQLQQVITNLAVNAHDAMPGGGTLYFDLSRINLAPGEALPCSAMEAGDWIKLTVRDTGNGISPEALPHIFEPFFTTKEVGQGTGLGLAQVYGIVQQHNGCTTVSSQEGQGATFTLYFPALATQAAAESEAAEATPMGQGETILLVEDEQIVRDVAQAMLERLNYRVLAAKDGAEALAMYRAQADQIALVLTDAVMPRMNGFALASALQAETPDLTVVLMSGYADDLEITPERMPKIAARLQKPMSPHQLAMALKEVLR